MIIETGDMWTVLNSGETDLFLFTGNSTIKKNGELVMGRGMALQVKQRYPDLPLAIGREIYHLGTYGIVVCKTPYACFGAFQVKRHYKLPASPTLIRTSCTVLLELLSKRPADYRVDVNFPGIGNGKLSEDVVMPIIACLPDNVHVWKLDRQQESVS